MGVRVVAKFFSNVHCRSLESAQSFSRSVTRKGLAKKLGVSETQVSVNPVAEERGAGFYLPVVVAGYTDTHRVEAALMGYVGNNGYVRAEART